VTVRAFFSFRLAVLGVAPLLLTGCSSHVVSGAQTAAEHHAELASERQQLEMIPPPSKTRYMAVHSYEAWENPYITVQPDMLTIHILLADANHTDFGAGGMLRPIGARRQEVNISPDKLAEAMSTLPEGSWPYGRVVAVEEAHNTPRQAEPLVRRKIEGTVSILNDLGIVAYDLADGTVR
jgi:hypothetical protein